MRQVPTSIIRPPYDAVIFDMDGVVTDTASVHAEAWRHLFEEVLADPRATSGTGGRATPFDPERDYAELVDGRRREDGVWAFLRSRGIEVPMGSPADRAETWSVHGMAARKNAIFLELVDRTGVRPFPSTVALATRLRAAGTPLAVVTASRNAGPVLTGAGVGGLFDVVVDGTAAGTLGLPGKPDPAMFLEAARRLGVTAGRTVVVEDAIAGVVAARRGGFGLVVAIDRAHRRALLEGAGADVVLDDVSQLDLGLSRAHPWRLVYGGFDPEHETHREVLTALGNGYVATRGVAPERSDDGVHYPGTYLAGVYNRLVSEVDGEPREDEELVNAPNWLFLDLRTEEGSWWSDGGLREVGERRELDLQRGLLTRTADLVDGRGRLVRLVQRRLVSMDRPHLAALETSLVPLGWSGRVGVRSGVDTAVVNGNAPESRLLAHRHLGPASVERVDADTVLVDVRTARSGVTIAMAVRTTVSGTASEAARAEEPREGLHVLHREVAVQDGRPVVLRKRVAICTSRDLAVASPRDGALAELERAAAGFGALARGHREAWQRLWGRFAVSIDTAQPVQLAVNLHVFHMLQAVSTHTAQLDAGVPARGLHGEGYRGHVFWDELFVLPLYVLRAPDVARSLLDYRWRRLDAARQAATLAGHRGAMFPWQSGSDGRDETPRLLFNPRSQRWMRDNSWRQRHVGLAVAYNAWQYWQATGDATWFAARGAELVIEVARFFASLSVYEERDDRFHVEAVMGPDEFHDGYPSRPGEGLRDNAYTNVLAVWVFQRAVESLSVVSPHERDELTGRLRVTEAEVRGWVERSRRMAVPFHGGVISQFDGYAELAEFDWEGYRRRYGSVERLDLILEAEGDSPNRYRVSKQADVLMLLYLLGPSVLQDLLNGLGYPVTGAGLARTTDYYLARTSNGSTLSRVVHASVLAMLDRSSAWTEFREALDADLDDTQGGTTGHGIHLGAMAGTVDLLLRTFTGMRLECGALVFRPRPPGALRRLGFEVRFRDHHIAVTLDQHALRLRASPCGAPPVPVVVDGSRAELAGGEVLEFPVPGPALAPP